MAIDPTMQMEPQSQDVGFVSEPNAMLPQEGGEMSVADDISMEATAEDFILPYESVLLTGLNQLNRYAREAIDLASENNVDLTGTNIDPTDKVPIKISNYEYRIPKPLVAYFGGGKNYLDKIQQEGLDLRKRLQEEGQDPAVQPEEQELAQTSQQVPEEQAPMMPPQEGMIEQPEAPMMPSTPPMMQKGGFVKDKDEYLNEDHPDVTKEEFKRFRRIFGRRPDSPPIILSDVDKHNAYVQMKSRHNFTDKDIFEQTHNAKVHKLYPREQMDVVLEQASGGFVLSKDQDAAMLEKDKAPTTQEQMRLKAQQPAMMTPDGKRVQQGFSAPAGYANGGDVMKGLGFKLEDVNRYNIGGMVKNAEDAVNMLNGIKSSFDREDKEMQRAQKKRGFA